MQIILQNRFMQFVLMVLLGAAYAMAFAPLSWWPLSIVALGYLFYCWQQQGIWQSARSGFYFGLGMFGVGISWMYVSISTFGGMPPLIAGFCIFILVALMSIYIALTGALQALLPVSATWRLILLMPVLWVLLEWLRGWLFTGLPWLLLGYSYLDTPLAHFAPLGGVFTVGLLAAVSITLIVYVLTQRKWLLLIPVALLWVAGFGLSQVTWTQDEEEKIRVAIVQNNISLGLKWDSERANRIVQDYQDVSENINNVDLIVWPEAAVPFYADQLLPQFWRKLDEHEADFMLGVLHRENVARNAPYYNAVAAVTGRDTIQFYKKSHLVPFGEYFPLQWLLRPLIDMLNIPMSNFSRWQSPQAPLEAAGAKFAVSICYEDAFPQVWRHQVSEAGALFNVSEDIWFGDSLAPHQRLQMARFRALETQKPMIRSSNNGLSALIDHKGKVLHLAPQFERDVVKGAVNLMRGATPYVSFGNTPVITVILLILAVLIISGLKRLSSLKKQRLR